MRHSLVESESYLKRGEVDGESECLFVFVVSVRDKSVSPNSLFKDRFIYVGLGGPMMTWLRPNESKYACRISMTRTMLSWYESALNRYVDLFR